MPTTQSLRTRATKLSNEDTFATSLLAICLDKYGTELFEQDPQTLWINLAEDFGANLPDENKDKIQALLMVYTTDLAFVSVEAFNHVCNVLAGSEANFVKWDFLEAEELIWGVYEIMLHSSLEMDRHEKPPEFSSEVRAYMGVVLKNDGIFDPPDILRLADMASSFDPVAEWADDPDITNAIFDKGKTDRARLLEFLGRRLLEMMQEMNEVVPALEYGDIDSWKKISSAISASAQSMVSEHQSAVEART